MKIHELVALLSEYEMNTLVRISTDGSGEADILEIDDRCCGHSEESSITLEG